MLVFGVINIHCCLTSRYIMLLS